MMDELNLALDLYEKNMISIQKASNIAGISLLDLHDLIRKEYNVKYELYE